MTLEEREEVILRAHEAGAFDEAWERYALPRGLSPETYDRECLKVVFALFAEGPLSRFLWRRAFRHLRKYRGVTLGWKNAAGDRYVFSDWAGGHITSKSSRIDRVE